MIIHEDWLMRQIDMMIAAVISFLFGKDGNRYSLTEELREERSARLKQRLTDLLKSGDLGEAENQLFYELERADKGTLAVAVDFYRQANALSDEELEAQGFTREELSDGLKEAVEMCGISIPGFWDSLKSE